MSYRNIFVQYSTVSSRATQNLRLLERTNVYILLIRTRLSILTLFNKRLIVINICTH